MATLTGSDARFRNMRLAEPLGAIATDGPSQTLSSSRRYEIGRAGDPFVVVANGEFHYACGDSTITALTTHAGPFPPGAYRFRLPNGCTHVAMIQGAAGAASGCAYAG